jgi:hypothetical protein
MTALKTQDRADASARGRKPWRKKTPVEVVLEQTDVLRRQIAAGEQELAEKRKQLARFEQAKKIFEAP